MTPVFQTRFGGLDAPWDEQGNCHAACLATIFDVELAAVPEPARPVDGHWSDPHIAWLAERGWTTWWHDLEIGVPVAVGGRIGIDWTATDAGHGHRFAIVSGRSPRGDWPHAVVFDTRSEKVVWDPHPDGSGILDVRDVQVFHEVAS